MKRIYRRNFLGFTVGFSSLGWLRAQADRRPVVVLIVSVTDERGRYINGLKSTDFRVFEDGILQTISTFATSDDNIKGPPQGNRAGERDKPQSDQETFETIRHDLMSSYKITYTPDPSNRNDGFRKFKVEIVPDVAKKWRVRHRPGYRPDRPILESERK